jgi:sulfur carrier protein ThiS
VASQKNPDSCTCVNGYGFSKSNGQCVPDWQYCVEDIGEPSYFDPTINACRCVSGYLIDSNKRCALADSVCEQKLGLGYWYDLDKKSCETCSKDTVRIGNLCLDSNILNAKTATSTLKDKIEKLHTEPDNFLVKNKQNVIPRSDDVQRIKDLEENAPKTQEAQTLEQVTTSTNVVKSEENTRAVRAWLGSILKSFFLLFGF